MINIPNHPATIANVLQAGKKSQAGLCFGLVDTVLRIRNNKSANGGGLHFMDALTLFGLLAVTAMLICYAFEDRSPWFVLAFAGACAMGSLYGFLQGAWPFGLVEAIWSVVALRRWNSQSRRLKTGKGN